MSQVTWGQRLGTGALAGAAGGVLATLVLELVVEPVINKSIAIEDARAAAVEVHDHGSGAHDHGGGEIVTRLQQQVGGGITVIVVAALLGVAFAVIYARSAHRMPGTTDLGRSLSLAAIAFTVAAVMPALTIPANPPAVGDPATVNQRTVTYISTIAFSIVAVGGIFALDRALASRNLSQEWRWLSVAGASVAALGVVMLVVPQVPQSIPSDVPAQLIWQFRIRSLAQLAALWAGIGIVHGVLMYRRAHRTAQMRMFDFA
ncbi:MAG TPA: CbtA family protein [Nocardioides sp.]|mgnify:CR=1 FL=1|uniref:CbtA family protein n=1 Tax=uncultured Nocardioides sp. TaxID=198441 RepID=UPI0026141762|nr:CbtA family protein [uncultured Nocardioides sp.]HRI94128.1 CbtA family protein [Nocardioides sp.]HRK44090.1 CbtA family protein [Nocardioides sp.]